VTLVLNQPRGELFATPLPYYVGWGAWAITHCQQADFYEGQSTIATPPLAVLHGVPSWLDPLRPYPPPPPPRPVPPNADPLQFNPPPPDAYRSIGQAGAARVYSVPDAERRSLLFVVAPTTWMFASGVVAERLRLALAQGTAAPSPLPAVAGAVSDVWMAKDAVFSHSLRAVVPGPCVSWIRDYEQSTAVGAAIFPPESPSGSQRYALRVFFSSADKAREAASDARALIMGGNLRRQVSCTSELVDARASGTALVLDGARSAL
jgi:hypothetical protein